MAQLSIRVVSPAVCSPASIKYHLVRVKKGRKEQGRLEGGGKVASQPGRESRFNTRNAREEDEWEGWIKKR